VLLAVIGGAGLALWQARVALGEKRRAEQAKTFIAGIFQDANLDEGQGKTLTALEVLRRANDRIDSALDAGPATRLELTNIVGSSLMSLGDYVTAETVADRAVRESQRLPADHALTLRARLLRSWVLMYRGKTKEMRKELDGVFPALERSPAITAEDRVFAWRLRCGLAIDEGNAEEAQVAGREAVRLADAGLSTYHREKLMALLELAYAYSQSRTIGHNSSRQVSVPSAWQWKGMARTWRIRM
jgi:eukaryotic-like serine/threonine-protein kinase